MSIIPITATLQLLLLLIVATTLVVGQDTGSCVSLATSQTCSAFSQFYIGLPGLARDYPFLLNTTTIEEFDKKLLAYVNSTSSYLFPMGCLSSNYNPIIPYARYSLTRLCAAMIQNPSYSLPCNFDNELSPPPLCQKTCFQWVDSVTRITDNPRVCSPSVQRNSTISYYNEQCSTWEGFNGTVFDNCISGIANEPYTCGFGPNDIRFACHYCKVNSDDMCCQNLSSCGSSLSAGAIVGIVIGCIISVALSIFAFVCIYHRNRKKPLVNPFHFMSSSAASSTTTTSQGRTKEYNNSEKISKKNIIDDNEPSETHSMKTSSNKLQIGSSFSNTIIIPSTATQTPSNSEEFYVVIHPYPPQMPDELELHPGDIICLALNFDDGWALGFNVTSGLKGAFPLVCIAPAPEECLDELLNMPSIIAAKEENQPRPLSIISKTAGSSQQKQQQLHSTMENIRGDIKRSLSLNSYNSMHHSFNNSNTSNTNNNNANNTTINTSNHPTGHLDTIPKRSVNYKSYDYIEAESPSSPTLHTPFFDPPPPPPPMQTLLQHDSTDYESQKKSPSL